MKKKYIVLVLGIVLLIGIVVWFIFSEAEEFEGGKEFADYPIRNDYCESANDCVVENMDYSSCSCNMKAVNKVYAKYVASRRAEPSDTYKHCNLYCKRLSSDCVDNQCIILD